MRIRANTALLSCLLLVAPSLFADHDKGKKGRRDEDEKKFERKVEVERENEQDNEDQVRVARRVQVVPANRVVIINNDVNRLESILATTQGSTVVFTQPTLIRVGNEANM